MGTFVKRVLAVFILACTKWTVSAQCSQNPVTVEDGNSFISAIECALNGTGSGEIHVKTDLTFSTLREFGTVLPLIQDVNLTIIGECSGYCYMRSLNGLTFMVISGGDDLDTRVKLSNLAFTGSYGQLLGGVIAAFHGSRLEIVNCLFEENSAHKFGGAVYLEGFDTRGFFTDTFLIQNTAQFGGAIAVRNQAVVIIDNSTFEGNNALNMRAFPPGDDIWAENNSKLFFFPDSTVGDDLDIYVGFGTSAHPGDEFDESFDGVQKITWSWPLVCLSGLLFLLQSAVDYLK